MSWPRPNLDAVWERINGWPDPVKGLRQQIVLFDRKCQQVIDGVIDDTLFLTPTARRRRIEFLNGYRALGIVVLSYNDMKTMTCATPQEEGEMLGISAKKLKEIIGCSLRTIQRRTLEYKDEFRFTVIDTPAGRDPKGRFKVIPAIVALTRGFYNWIGEESARWFDNMTKPIEEKRDKRERHAAAKKALTIKPNPPDKSWATWACNIVKKNFLKLSSDVKSKVYERIFLADAHLTEAELIALTEELATGPP